MTNIKFFRCCLNIAQSSTIKKKKQPKFEVSNSKNKKMGQLSVFPEGLEARYSFQVRLHKYVNPSMSYLASTSPFIISVGRLVQRSFYSYKPQAKTIKAFQKSTYIIYICTASFTNKTFFFAEVFPFFFTKTKEISRFVLLLRLHRILRTSLNYFFKVCIFTTIVAKYF